MSEQFKIGVDGGGSKTELILVNAAGEIAGRCSAPGCNPSLLGPDQARRVLEEALHQLAASSAAPVASCLLCMAGSRGFWREVADNLRGFGKVTATDDSLPVLELATGGAPGLALHAGTGSFVAARGPEGAIHFAGGLGWRLGDPGSAHDLGRRAVARTLLELQGWAPSSALGDAVRTATGRPDGPALLRHCYAPGETAAALAALAPQVTALAGRADPVATEILTESAGELGRLAHRVAVKLFPDSAGIVSCGLSGPILQSPAARKAIEGALGPRFAFRAVTEPPIEGVRRLLARQ